MIIECDDIIGYSANLEIKNKRASAAKMILCEFKLKEMSVILNVSPGLMKKRNMMWKKLET